MRTRRTGVTPLVVLLLLMPAATPVGATESPAAGRQAQSPEDAPAPGRLRFRSKGPACMCLDGLSEAEIAAAERARKASADALPAIIGNP